MILTDNQKGPPMTEILMLNIAWMLRYRGLRNDVPSGKFRFMSDGSVPHEIFNFMPHNGRCYGYAPVRNGTININNLGADSQDEEVSNVLVVWTATHPDGGRFVVGWYKNATVYREARERPGSEKARIAGRIHYNTSASSGDCDVVPLDERVFPVPTMQRGFPGIAPAFFPRRSAPRQWVDSLLRYIEQGHVSGSNEAEPKDAADPDFKAMIEKSAVKVITDHYGSQGFNVISREKDNLGWDLEARRGGRTLRLEVKGLSSDQPVVEVTPNEYAAMTSPTTRSSYRVCIVCRPHKPNETQMWICNYDRRIDAWVSDDLKPLKVAERVAAKLSLDIRAPSHD